MTYHGLAEEILNSIDKPLTPNEIWDLAVEKGLDKQLNSSGKTPWATLGARLYVISRDNPDSIFKSVGKRPKRFYLTTKQYHIDFKEYEAGKTEEEAAVIKQKQVSKYLEKDLHPFLAHFAFYKLNCHTLTIQHSKSSKKSFGEWMHPDMVGCVFPIDEWDNELLELSSVIGNTSVRFLSFELKKSLDLATLRAKFFQAVSNSSWAHESYLVAANISTNEDFLAELRRLSTAFGIGVIQLNIQDPNSSEILFPAKIKDVLDWDTMNKLVSMNTDFKRFVKRVQIDLKSKEIRHEKYDKILDESKLIKSIKD